MIIPKLAESESFVKGRSIKTARALVEAAGKRSREVRAVSHGYIVPTEFVQDGMKAYTAADRPAVHTEPGTSTNVDEVFNIGQAPASDARGLSPEDEEFAKANPENAGDDTNLFDPSKATVDDVIAHLTGADDTERERVLSAEAAGKKRKGILDLAATPEGAK